MRFGGGGHGGRGEGAAAMTGGGRWRQNGGRGFDSPQMRYAHQSMRGFGGHELRGGGRQQFRMAQRQQGPGAFREQFRMDQRQHGNAFARREHNFARQQSPAFAQRQGRGFGRQQAQAFARQPLRGFAGQRAANAFNQPGMMDSRQQLGNGRMPPPAQQQALGNTPFGVQRLGGHGQGFVGQNSPAGAAYAQNWAASPYAGLSYGNNVQVLPVERVQGFIGAPVAQVASIAPLSPIPAEISYLYPATPDYYYEWGDGYLYQIDRSDNLIAALVPLIAGGYLPGEYLPASYMASYVPDYYGFDSFYPDYGDVCNRYYDGVIYEVDCADGYVENVVPMYAGGYGVGQLLPATYGYYNVPVQYRSMYYNTPDAGYWYSPGAIYQYDPHTSVITSVAALMAPGFTIGQALPVGYDVYNIPLPYRATYYDTPNAWYRYNNGYIYQIDPVTQIVTAIVASLLT